MLPRSDERRPQVRIGTMSGFDTPVFGSPRHSSKVAAEAVPTIYTSAPDPLIQHLGFPDKFYICATFTENPPEVGVRPIDDDTSLLLHALHEQASKGPCTKSRPWSLFETDTQLRWDAWKALEQMPALEAMTLFVRTVEEDNPEWWHLLTHNLSFSEKKDIVETAAACAKEYKVFVDAGVLVGPSSRNLPAYLSQEPQSTQSENLDWSDAATALKLVGLQHIADMIDFLSTSRPVKPRSRGDRSINHPKYLPPDKTDTVSASAMKNRLKNAQNAPAEKATNALADISRTVGSYEHLDGITNMLIWRVLQCKGVTRPTERYHHCVWLVDGRRMWVAYGSKDGKKLTGDTLFVLDMKTLVWTTRNAIEENGEQAVAVSGAASLVAPNEAVYVFGGEAKRGVKGLEGFFGGDRGDGKNKNNSNDRGDFITTRCLDLTEDPGPVESGKDCKGKIKQQMEWIDLTTVVGDGSNSSSNPSVNASSPNALSERLQKTTLEDDRLNVVIIDDEIMQDVGVAVSSAAAVNGATILSSIHTSQPSPISAPCARFQHTATLIGGEVYVFGGCVVGGESFANVLNDLWAFDGAEGTWRQCHGAGAAGGVIGKRGGKVLNVADTKWHGAPAPRSGHVANAVDDRFLVIHGGDVFDREVGRVQDRDAHVFDTWSERWVEVSVTGKPPKPRSGHASCVIGTSMYVSGGGDDKEARPETYRLDCANAKDGQYHWQVVNTGVGEGQQRSAGCEGMSLIPFRSTTGEFLIAFGGSDGTCRNDVRVMRVSDWTTGKGTNAAA